MSRIFSLMLLVIGVVIALWLIGLLATAIALPVVVWTLIKVLVVLAALAYVLRLFGVIV
jgi:hypothetical protein